MIRIKENDFIMLLRNDDLYCTLKLTAKYTYRFSYYCTGIETKFMKFSRLLSSGQNNKVIALSEMEVAKLYTGDTRSDIGSEAEKMKFANIVNGLVAKFIRLDYDESLQAEMLVMERIYPFDFRAYEVEKRELWWDVFED